MPIRPPGARAVRHDKSKAVPRRRNSAFSGSSSAAGSADALQAGGEGGSIQQILKYFGNAKFVTTGMSIISDAMNAKAMFEAKSYLSSGSSLG